MSEVRVKICGLTRLADVNAAVESGADMLGFVFAHSPRQLSMAAATELLRAVPAGVMSVGLFMNQQAIHVQELLDKLDLDLLQFHGSEDNEFCAAFGMPFIKAIPMGGDALPADGSAMYPAAQGLLYDSHAPGGPGGSGDTFDWSLLPLGGRQIWLAGGLTATNVSIAVKQCRPWAVDVSSGVEDRPGIKNHDQIRAFIRAAKSVL